MDANLPLFDPLDDQPPFPFPNVEVGDTPSQIPVFSYKFDRPIHRLLIDHAIEQQGVPEAIFGHCIVVEQDTGPQGALELNPRGLARQGAVGVALKIIDVQGNAADRSQTSVASESTMVRCVGAYRFRVTRVTRSIPFVCADVEQLKDYEIPVGSQEESRTMELEDAVINVFRRLIELSAKIEALGQGAEAAEAQLSTPTAFLDAHDQRVADNGYASNRERWEFFSHGVCDFLELPYDTAVAALSTVSAAERFELILLRLREAVSEISALAEIDSLNEAAVTSDRGTLLDQIGEGLTTDEADTFPSDDMVEQLLNKMSSEDGTFTPVDIPLGQESFSQKTRSEKLPEGTCIEFWWNEEWGWCPATVRRQLQIGDQVQHTLEFDSDGSWVDVSLTFEDGNRRWRPAGPTMN